MRLLIGLLATSVWAQITPFPGPTAGQAATVISSGCAIGSTTGSCTGQTAETCANISLTTTGATSIDVYSSHGNSQNHTTFSITDSVGGQSNSWDNHTAIGSGGTFVREAGTGGQPMTTADHLNAPSHTGASHNFQVLSDSASTSLAPSICVIAWGRATTYAGTSSFANSSGVTTLQAGAAITVSSESALSTCLGWTTPDITPSVDSSFTGLITAAFTSGVSYGLGCAVLDTASGTIQPTWTASASNNLSMLIIQNNSN